MSIISLVVTLVILGIVWWLVTTQLPIAEPFLTIAKVVIVLFLCALLLSWAGWLPAGWHGGHLRGPC